MTFRPRSTRAAACLLLAASCAAQHTAHRSDSIMHTDARVPAATTFTSAPLRHRLRVELRATVPDVWALVGQHVRLPEYTAGIASVEVEEAVGSLRARVCHF